MGMKPDELGSAKFERGRGCPNCSNTGFRGRLGIFEVFSVNEEIQRLIYESATSHFLRRRARELGMRTMREDGIRKVLSGLTTVDEVASVTAGDVS
jgi:general secretion pathway protein E/type IV pilus assembly protein PilB